MTKVEEAIFEKKAEREFRSHQQSPLGRDFRAFRYRFDHPATDPDFESRFNETFPGAPGSPTWLDRKFGGA